MEKAINKNSITYYEKFAEKSDVIAHYCAIAAGLMLPISITALNITLIATVVFSLLSGKLKEKWEVLSGNKIVYLLLIFYSFLWLSLFYTSAPVSDSFNALHKYTKLLYVIFLMPLFINDKWKRMGINAFLAAMIITFILSIMKKFGWINMGDAGDYANIFTNHINTGLLMGFATFILAHRCFEKSHRWFYVILSVLFIYHLFFLNEGRTGYLVIFALLVLFFWQKVGWKGSLLATSLIPIIFTTLFISSPNFKQRILMVEKDIHNYQQQQLADNSIGLRMEFDKNSFTLIKAHPWMGTGVGSFRHEYKTHFPPAPGFSNLGNPQNEYLLITVQLGLLGLALFLLLFLLEFRQTFTLNTEMCQLAQGMIVAFMAGCTSDSFLYLAIPGYFFVYFTGLFFSKHTHRELTSAYKFK